MPMGMPQCDTVPLAVPVRMNHVRVTPAPLAVPGATETGGTFTANEGATSTHGTGGGTSGADAAGTSDDAHGDDPGARGADSSGRTS